VTRKAELLGLAIVLILITLAFADLLATRRVLYVRDVARIYVPQRVAFRDAVRDGFPFWNPRFAAGQPMAANPEYEVFYPPQWLVLLPNLLFGFALEVVGHFLFAAAGMFVFLRRLRVRAEGAAFGALCFALGGVMLSLANLLPYLFALAWWPWLGLFADRFFERRRAADFALAALALGMVLLIGEPSTILQTGALLGAFAFARVRPAQAIGWTAALCAVAFLVGAAQVVPAIDLSHDTTRAATLAARDVMAWSLAPSRPLELLGLEIAPAGARGLNWLVSWYGGMLAAALIVAGFVRRVRGWPLVAAVTLAGYALALGDRSPLLRALHAAGLMNIRYPEKWFLAPAFVLVVFAALAAERFFDDPRFRRTTHIAAGALVALNAIGGLTRGLAMAAALALILFLRGRLQLVLLAAFVLVDLVPRVYGIAPRVDASYYTQRPPAAAGLAPRSRIYNDADWAAYATQTPPTWTAIHDSMLPETQTLWGFDSVLETDVTLLFLRPTADLQRLFLRTRYGPNVASMPLLLSLAGATHAITPQGSVVALHNEKLTIATALAATDRIAEPHPWPRGVAFVDRPFAPAAARIGRVRETANTIDADVDADGRALLVVAVTAHKYWQASIDGAPAPLVRANVAFQAIEVPRGRHHVAMRYRNPLVVACACVSLIAAAALATVAALRSRAPRLPSPR
jgi:Bacterial membrane protein YfhO